MRFAVVLVAVVACNDPDKPVACSTDADCHRAPCGPCDPGAVITAKRARQTCVVNPCRNTSAVCNARHVCEVGPGTTQNPVAWGKPHLQIWPAPEDVTDLAGVVRTELANATRDGRQLLVYVGASWCEPCTRFHDAAQAGTLDDALGHLRLLELDFDKHGDALHRAGYRSELIPLFAVPNPDGTASGRQIEGSIKGEGAVAEITPRLKALLVQ